MRSGPTDCSATAVSPWSARRFEVEGFDLRASAEGRKRRGGWSLLFADRCTILHGVMLMSSSLRMLLTPNIFGVVHT